MTEASLVQHSQGPRYVLVVDDDAQARTEILALLESAGILALGAPDGTQALAQVQSLRPSVILLQVAVPRLGRVQLGRALRADRGLGVIPTISMWDRVRNPTGMKGEGPILTKPVDGQFLLRLVRSHLRESSASR